MFYSTNTEYNPDRFLLSRPEQQQTTTTNGILVLFQVWSTGLAPTELVSSMEGVEKERGRIKIDGRLRVPGMDGVFAMGDAAAHPENPLGPLAQVADQQGKVTGGLVYVFACLFMR